MFTRCDPSRPCIPSQLKILHLFIHLIRFPEALRSRTWQRRNVAFSLNIALPPLHLSLLLPDHCPASLRWREIRTPTGASAARLIPRRCRGSPGLLFLLQQPRQGAATFLLWELAPWSHHHLQRGIRAGPPGVRDLSHLANLSKVPRAARLGSTRRGIF